MKTYRSNIFVLFFSLLCLLSTTKKFQPNMEIKIGHHIFNANLNSNSSAIKFKALLPLNLNMIELNGNEKYASLPISLPVNHEKVNKIKAGDIMLYGDDTLVIFYKDFSTPYSYTRLGHITDTTALVKALGSGNISVNFR